MENHPGALIGLLFLWCEVFALSLYLFGAPVIVWFPVAAFIPALMIAACIKVTYDEWKEKHER